VKKIITLFQRNHDGDHLVRNEVTPGAEWVIAGEGVATRKWDGTCCMVRGGKLYKRYEVKPGNMPPADFEPADMPDIVTGKQPGWRPVTDSPHDKHHIEAFTGTEPDGTYELLGPKIQSNPEGMDRHRLIPHGQRAVDAPRTFDGLRDYLDRAHIEGVIWHHPDGRMVKIKAKDFGIDRTNCQPTFG